MKIKNQNQKIRATAVGLCLCCAGSGLLTGQIQLNEDHVDIGINYESGSWDLHIHDEETNTEYAPNEAVFNVFSNVFGAVGSVAAGELGLNTGDNAWILPQNDPGEGSGIIFLGISAEELATGIFDSDEISISLSLQSGPANGEFAVFRGSGLSFESLLSTANSTSGSLTLVANNTPGEPHEHFAYGFTEAGTYLVDITASGLIGGNPTSDTQTYTFNVTTAIPEPSSGLLTLLGLGLLHWWRKGRN